MNWKDKVESGCDWLLNKLFSSHLSIGPLTVFGRNAMHWAVNIKTEKYGYVCFRLPLRCFGRWWPLYLYCSPNATPWASTFMIGGYDREDRALAPLRHYLFGHNFDTELCREDLQKVNRGII